jgi:hypothetical protein
MSKGYDKWTATDAPQFALAGEEDFSPLRAPGSSSPAERTSAPAPVEVKAEDIVPGMRQIGGEWFYSAAWI